MQPIWPNTDRIPVWIWPLAMAGLIGVAFWTSTPDFDAALAMLRLRQGITVGILAGGALWTWRGGLVLWWLRALRARGVPAEAEVTRYWSDSQRVERSGTFAVGSTVVRQLFITYRFTGSIGDVTCPRRRIDQELWQSLREGRHFAICYLPNRPSVSRPVGLALTPAKFTRTLQLVSGLALAASSGFVLAPGTPW